LAAVHARLVFKPVKGGCEVARVSERGSSGVCGNDRHVARRRETLPCPAISFQVAAGEPAWGYYDTRTWAGSSRAISVHSKFDSRSLEC
jgi:hypothetical protein